MLAQLANDAALHDQRREHWPTSLTDTGWQSALAELPARVSRLAATLDAARQSRREADAREQLAARAHLSARPPRWARRGASPISHERSSYGSLQFIHLFSGGGGDLQAVEMIGGYGVLAANHWTCAVENSGANYPDIEHLIGDLAIAEPAQASARRSGDAPVLCASPECDGWSLSRNYQEEVSRLGPFDPKQGIGRSRATVYCPMRFATALPNLTTIIMEQVVDMVREARDFARYVARMGQARLACPGGHARTARYGAPRHSPVTGCTCSSPARASPRPTPTSGRCAVACVAKPTCSASRRGRPRR